MAFTKIAAAGIGSTGTVILEDIRANSLVVSGVSTLGSVVATTGTFSGNVSIAGTLTYEDVTNIDSVGLITARSGVVVNTGTATTALVVNGSARITGILTIGTSSVTLDGTNNQVNVGTGVTIHHTNGVQVGGNTLHSSGLTVNSLNASGVITATSFSGDGSNLTNTGSTLSAASGSQRVVLTGQTSGTMTSSATSASLTFDASTGALSATSFSGSGANLTGIAATTNVRTNSLVVSGVSTFAAGSLGAPSISAEGDSNTGIYFPAADTLQVVTGGNSRVRVSAGGTVLLNTTSSEGIVLRAAGTGWGGGNGSGTNSGRSDGQFIFDGVGLDNSGSVNPVGFQIRGGGGGVPRGFVFGAYGRYEVSGESSIFFVSNTGNAYFDTTNGTPQAGVYRGPVDVYGSPAASSWWRYSLNALFGIRDAKTSNYDGGSKVGQSIELGGTYGGGSPGAWGGTCSAVRIATNFGSGSQGTNIGYYADISGAGSGNNWGLYIANGNAAKPGGGSFTATSDSRVKNISGSYARGLEEITQLNPVRFTYNGKGETPTDNQERVGLIAQEVKEIIPEIVSTRLGKLNEGDEENTQIMMVDPSDLVFALVNACKELKSEVTSLQARLDAAGI